MNHSGEMFAGDTKKLCAGTKNITYELVTTTQSADEPKENQIEKCLEASYGLEGQNIGEKSAALKRVQASESHGGMTLAEANPDKLSSVNKSRVVLD